MYPSVPIMTLRSGVAGRDRDPEVRDPDSSILIDQDIGGFQVAMKNALGMSRSEPGTQLVGDFEHPFGCQTARALEKGREILPCTNSIEKKIVSPASPTSKTRHTAGCVICRASRTS